MKAVFVQTSHSIDYTPTANVAAGDVIVVGDLIGIAKLDIPANCLGTLSICGVFDVEKAEASAFAVGDNVYWDNAAKVATTVAGGNKYMGKAIEVAAVAADGVNPAVRIVLNAPFSVPAVAIVAANAIVDANLAGAAGADYTKGELDTDLGALETKVNAILAALRSTGIVAPNA